MGTRASWTYPLGAVHPGQLADLAVRANPARGKALRAVRLVMKGGVIVRERTCARRAARPRGAASAGVAGADHDHIVWIRVTGTSRVLIAAGYRSSSTALMPPSANSSRSVRWIWSMADGSGRPGSSMRMAAPGSRSQSSEPGGLWGVNL